MWLWNELFNRSPKDKRDFFNEHPLPLEEYYSEEIGKLDFAAFPLVEDFTVQLTHKGYFGVHLYFYSERLGRLANFAWWDNVEKELPTYTSKDIPMGDFEEPYADSEQSWQILIFGDQDFAYILQGSDMSCHEFGIWFKVPRERYFSEWMRVIREFNPAA